MTDSTAFACARQHIAGSSLSTEDTITGRGLTLTLPPSSVSFQRADDWLHDIVTEIKELELLPEGWDGGVACPVSSRSAATARRLAEQAVALVPGLRRPCITPTVDGNVVLEWHGPAAHLEITAGDASADIFYEMSTDGEWEGPFDQSPKDPAELLTNHFC